MDIPTIIALVAVLALVLAFVLQPFFTDTDDGTEGRSYRALDEIRQRAALLVERNRIYAAIRTLDFDHSTHKVSDDDYADQRHALVAQGVDVLKQFDTLPPLDETPAYDPIEAALLALRAGGSVAAAIPVRGRTARGKGKSKAGGRTSFCPHCGKPVVQGDLFCGLCGNQL